MDEEYKEEYRTLFLKLLSELDEARFRDFQERIGANDRTIRDVLNRLIKQGLVVKDDGIHPTYRITEKGREELELEVQKNREELEWRSESEKDIYKTTWLFRDFVHRDLATRKSPVKSALKVVATLGLAAVYSDVKPIFRPNEDEKDYANLLMTLYVDSVNYERLFVSYRGLESLVRVYSNYKRTIAKSIWAITSSFKNEHFDYPSVFTRNDVQKLISRPFVKTLENNYLEALQEECSKAIGQPITLTRDDFIKIICWMRLKAWSMPVRAYEQLREYLLRIALADLGMIKPG